MVEGHIPAWKRIAILKRKNQETDELTSQEDPLNVTVHLATGALSKKEKKRIINGNIDIVSSKDALPKTDKRVKKKEKLAKEERILNKTRVLRDQLRYLIDFYRTKVDEHLPSSLSQLESIKLNYPEALQLKPEQVGNGTNDTKKEAEEEEEPRVVEVWKFSKQKQNWLLKHFFNVEEIPLAYNDLLVSYFQDLKGGSRADLLKKCLSQVHSWNSYVEEEENKIKAVVEGTEAQTSTTKDSEEDKETDRPVDDKSAKATEAQKETKDEPETVVPDRDVVLRSYKLLTKWRELGEEGSELSTLEMRQFG